MAQTWRDLLFAHWRVPAAALARVVPPQLELDLWNGEAWIGVVPFRMDRIHPRGTVPLPWLSATPEINVRTYVTYKGKRGVYFFSLDAANIVAVKIARRFFHLPYFHAEMSVRDEGEKIHYTTHRENAEFCGTYGPCGDVFASQPGTLEHWLTERYCFYTLDAAGKVVRGNIDHAPWPLQLSRALIKENRMTAPIGIELEGEPMLHFARKIEVVVWMPERA